jgi:hypothetical protein
LKTIKSLEETNRVTGELLARLGVFVLTVSGGEITRFRMLEDSFAVSRAARIQPEPRP